MVNANIGFVLIKALYYFYTLLEYAILARCILSWLPIGQNNIFARILVAITEPIMGPIRKLIYKSPTWQRYDGRFFASVGVISNNVHI